MSHSGDFGFSAAQLARMSRDDARPVGKPAKILSQGRWMPIEEFKKTDEYKKARARGYYGDL